MMKFFSLVIVMFLFHTTQSQIVKRGDERIRNLVGQLATNNACFWIIIYSGGSSNEANKIRNQYLGEFTNSIDVIIDSRPPTYVVKVGKFRSKEKAEAFATKIRGRYPVTRLTPPEGDCWPKSIND